MNTYENIGDGTFAIFSPSAIGGLDIETKHATITIDRAKYANASRNAVDAEQSGRLI